MGFWDTVSKVVKVAGEIASEMINVAPEAINSKYLEQAENKLYLNSHEKNLISKAKELNNNLKSNKFDLNKTKNNIKKINDEIDKINELKQNEISEIWNYLTSKFQTSSEAEIKTQKKNNSLSVNFNNSNEYHCIENIILNLPNSENYTNLNLYNKSLNDYIFKYSKLLTFKDIDNDFSNQIQNKISDLITLNENNEKKINSLNYELNKLDEELKTRTQICKELKTKTKDIMDEVKRFCAPKFNELKRK